MRVCADHPSSRKSRSSTGAAARVVFGVFQSSRAALVRASADYRAGGRKLPMGSYCRSCSQPSAYEMSSMALEIWKWPFPWSSSFPPHRSEMIQQLRGNHGGRHFHMSTISTPYGGTSPPWTGGKAAVEGQSVHAFNSSR
jgi:hypothetical protein